MDPQSGKDDQLMRMLGIKKRLSAIPDKVQIQSVTCINPGVNGRQLNSILGRIRLVTPGLNVPSPVSDRAISSSMGLKFQQGRGNGYQIHAMKNPLGAVRPVAFSDGVFTLSGSQYSGSGQLPSLMTVKPILLSKSRLASTAIVDIYDDLKVFSRAQLEGMEKARIQDVARNVKAKLKQLKNKAVTIHLTVKGGVPITKEQLIDSILSAYSVMGIIL